MARVGALAEGLERLVPVRGLSIFVVDPRSAGADPGPDRALIRGFELDALRAYATHYRRFDPMASMFVEAPGRAARLSDHAAPRSIGRDAFTGEFLPRHGLRHILAGLGALPGGARLALALHRAPTPGDFTDRERQLVERLLSDIARAAAGALAREDADARLRAGAAAGAIVMDAAGRPLHADPVATALFGDVDDATRSGLADHARAVAARGEGAVATRVFALGGGRAVAARASSFRAAGALHVLVVLREADALASTIHDDAALTPRERQVAGLVLEGLTNREIADELGLSPATVGVYVTRVLRKRGARGRLELVRDALRGRPPEA